MRCITVEAEDAFDMLGLLQLLEKPQHDKATAKNSAKDGGDDAVVALLAEDQLSQVLALRGLLACKVMQHCLQKRHRVDYGVNRCVRAACCRPTYTTCY